MFLLVATTIAHQDFLFRLTALDRSGQCLAGLHAHQVGLLHSRGDDIAVFEKLDEFWDAVEGRHYGFVRRGAPP